MSEEGTVARALWRAEEARWMGAALERWEHDRGLADVLLDLMHHGDHVSFRFAAIVWSGRLVAVGRDVARIDTGHGVVDVRLAPESPFVVRTRTAPGGGTRGDGTATTFAARLRELDGTCARIGTSIGEAGDFLEGVVRLGRDQIRVVDRDDGCTYVPLASVWWARAVDD